MNENIIYVTVNDEIQGYTIPELQAILTEAERMKSRLAYFESKYWMLENEQVATLRFEDKKFDREV
jgi:hypothetical protein